MMSSVHSSEILFVGWGGPDGVTHFRTVLPARMLGAEWCVIDNEGQVAFKESTRDMHKIIIVQNCWNHWQLKHVRSMRKHGAKVLLNVDDWIKTIGKMEGRHAFASSFKKKDILEVHYQLLRECDGILVSTPWLVSRMKQFHSKVAIARNLIDLERFVVPEIDRDAGTIIGWAGGTGHKGALRGVAPAIREVMEQRPDTQFVSLGENVFDIIGESSRVHTIPWQDLHVYPRDLKVIDVGIAPTEPNDFYKAKSQLRFYEAGAARIPLVASSHYTEIRHGDTGFIADTHEQWVEYLLYLVDNESERKRVAVAARNYVEGSVAGDARAEEWREAIGSLVCPVQQASTTTNKNLLHDVQEKSVGQLESSRPSPHSGRPLPVLTRPEEFCIGYKELQNMEGHLG